MQKLLALLLTIGFPLTVQAQVFFNSLDVASPPFTERQREALLSGKGLYFTKTTFPQSTLSGWVYKGVGGISGGTTLAASYSFFMGPSGVGWQTYFDNIGLGDMVTQYNNIHGSRILKTTVGIAGVAVGTLFLTLATLDYVAPMADLSSTGQLTYQHAVFGSSQADVGIAVGSLIVAILTGIYWATQPNYPAPPSDDYLALMSNRENRRLLQ